MGNNLKKALFLLLILVFISFEPVLVLAEEEISSNDFGIEQTGILPSNPFYFFKTWGRNIRQTFSFSNLSRAELQLSILNEQAAEIRKLDELNVTKIEAFLKALDSFKEGVSVLGLRMMVLKGAPGVDKLVDNFLDKTLKYQDVLDGIIYKFENNENAEKLRESASNALDKLLEVVLLVPSNVISVKKFTESFELAVAGQRGELREFRAVEFINRLEPLSSGELLAALLKTKDSLLLKFSGRLQVSKTENYKVLNFLEGFSGDILLRLKAVDEAREKIVDLEVKNQINIIRKHIFDKVKMKNLISEITAKDALTNVQDKLTEIASVLVEQTSKTPTNVAQIIERARFNFEEARKFYEDESFSSSYSQALSASAAVENALSQIIMTSNDLGEELKTIKIYFDSLSSVAHRANVIDSKVLNEFKDIEKTIVHLADLIGDNKNLTQARKIMRELKSRMALLSKMLDQEIAQD